MSADLLRRLIEAGTPADLVADVAMLVGEVAALERRRQSDRDRQAARRHVTSRDAQGVTLCHDPAPAPDKSPPDPQKLTPTPPTHTNAPARKADPFPRPVWAEPQVWSDLLANRRKKGLANTVSAHRKLMADIDRLTDADWPPGRVLEAAVSRGWGAIYAGCKDDENGRTHRMARHQPADGLSSTARAGLDVFGPGNLRSVSQ